MTFTNQTNRISAVGSGATGQIVPFTFPITDNSDLLVKKRVTATGVETTLDETTNYTVSNGGINGGSITTVTTIETTEQIHIIRNSPFNQQLDLKQGGDFNAESLEAMGDKNAKLNVENKDLLDNKAILFPETDASSLTNVLPSSIDRASKVLSFDSAGNATASDAVPTGSVSFTTFGTNMAEAANALAGKDVINLNHVYDVTDTVYGADNTGVADSSTAIQLAADTAAAAGGGVVFLPDGTYLLNTVISVPLKVSIKGSGSPSVTINAVGCSAFLYDENYTEYVKISGMTIKGEGYWATENSDTSTTLLGSPSTFVGIDIGDNVTFRHSIRIKDIECELFKYGVRIQKSFTISFDGLLLKNNQYGIHIDDTSGAGTANSVISGKDIWCKYNGFSIWMTEVQSAYFSNTVNQFFRNHAGIFMDSCRQVVFDELYCEFLNTPGDLGVATSHPTDTPTATLIWDSDSSTGTKQFVHMTNCTRNTFQNIRMQRFRIGFYIRLSSLNLIDTIWEVDRLDLTLGGVSYNASIINYAGSTVESVSVDNRYMQTSEPIISRNLTTAGRRGGMIWYKDTQKVYEKNNTRTLIDETGIFGQQTTDGLTIWVRTVPKVGDLLCNENQVVCNENEIVTNL